MKQKKITFKDKFKHIFGIHKYYLIHEFSSYSRKIGCELCDKQFAMNDDNRCVLEWDTEFEDLYRRLYKDYAAASTLIKSKMDRQ